MLKVSNLSVSYGNTRIIRNLNFSLGEDEILMLVGPTGCGKTTILQALAGLIPISEGQICLDNWRATPDRFVQPEKRNVGMVFQDFALFPHLSTEQNIYFRLKNKELAERWIQVLGLEELRHARPATLSGGQKQRVALARTLAHNPACVLLDEPLSNLDAALKDSLRWEIRNALKEAGVPAIWVTHDQEEALSVGDRIGVLNNGVLCQLDTPENCFSEPASRFVARFLGEASFLPGRLSDDQKTVHTTLGEAPAIPINDASDQVDLLIRPDDLSLQQDSTGHGHISWVRYEGGARFYAVQLDDDTEVKVRVSHEHRLEPGERVSLSIITTHPLAAYAKR
ncbi:ABC transporter ATP-binding protein [Lacimicrobium alkaliphilum]|uniref:ABC transporter ATP-binding protein n=1 Tax=Lacimicrobium alkaliphilum TaxID=1526571 RepID=A0ABQ1R2S3_9ALTE|nr:ABC transporter ATP-binding protein [Lacimicrobium alkaliphilum]GGD52839.1 ABC transporter ATP-binding protein [Lacimicrobium alkaliphilum]